MNFFDLFRPLTGSSHHLSSDNKANGLHEKLHRAMPDAPEDELIQVACIAGLMARIAYADMEVHREEIISIEGSLADWTSLEESKIAIIAKLAVHEIQDLMGVENHLYTRTLQQLLTETERYKLLIALFAVAAGDGKVEIQETHEIKNICKGLLLEQKHFLSARTSVLDKLEALKPHC